MNGCHVFDSSVLSLQHVQLELTNEDILLNVQQNNVEPQTQTLQGHAIV